MVWTDTQQWLADNQRTVFYRLPVIRQFVTTPDDEAHQDLRERVSTVYGACIDANNSSFDKCHQLYGEVIGQSWIEHGPGGIDPEALSEDNLAGIQQTLTDIKQRLNDTVMTESEPTIDHVPPVDGPLWHAYLTRSERSKIEELERQFACLRTVGDLAEELRTLRQEYLKLQETLAPFSEFKRYLPTTEKQELLDHLSELDTQITQVQAQLNAPPQAVAEQFDELRVQIETDKQFVRNYNDGNSDFVGFVPREITRYKNSLFSEYDEANHSLNSKQAEAVVRNDQANQIVAGPGTGKTVTLTARIAYLIRGLGIDPDRIVALTFTNEATTEMATRLEQWFDITAVDCSTLHSFGLDIATDYQDTPRDLIEEDDVRNFIEQRVGELQEIDPEFQRDYAEFLQRMNDDLLDQSAFDSKDEFYDARKDKQYTTLKDETVESRAEKVIADWLFAHGIEYQHERLATWAETADDKGTYNPDFYLPEHDLYIEHWGIDENAEVAPWFTWSSEEYLEKLTWARGQFANTDEYTLINTYEFEHDADRLEAVLEHRLQVNDVPIKRKSDTELIEDTYRYNNAEGRVYDKLLKFVHNAKQFNLSRGEIESNLSENDLRQYFFAQCGLRLYEDFLEYLESNQLIVFSDMISTAAEAVTDPDTAYGEAYDHVLVDEFQDVSGTNVKLLQELTRGSDGPRLFCVGDDWQSIYSFQGSEVEYFVRFNEYFTAATQTTLTENYRSPAEIVEAGKTLINNNDRQISKNLTAVADTETVPRLHILPDTTDYEYKESTGQFAAERTQRYLTDEGSTPGDIMILCHLDKGAPYLDTVKSELKERQIPYDGKNDQYRPHTGPYSSVGYDDDGVSVFSIHQSKGKEAEHVIVLHATNDDDGIPLADRGNLLAPVKPTDTNSEAEARRLFYVAITRAEGTLDITTRRDRHSKFVAELADHLSDVHQLDTLRDTDTQVTVEAVVSKSFEDIHDSKCQEGILTDETGTQRFVIWDDTDFAPLHPGTRYRFHGADVSSFGNQLELHLTDSTDVTTLGNTETTVESTDTVIEAEVNTLFDDQPEAIQQKGILWDGSEQLYVTTWASNDTQELVEGTTYRFVNPRLDEWNGTTDLVVTSETQVERIESD